MFIRSTEIFIDIFCKYAIFRVTRPCTPLNNASHVGLFFCPNDFQEGKLIFSKPPRTPEYLARKLIQNGLQGIIELELTEIFQSINYYKLRGYTYPYLALLQNDWERASEEFRNHYISTYPESPPCRIYASICIIQSLLNICYKENTFATELKELMKMVRKEQLPTMGFPQNWQNEDLFNLK